MENGPDLNVRWEDTYYLTIDTEATGFYSEDRICEIAFCVAKDGKVLQRYSQRVNPMVPFNEKATAVHGMDQETVKDCPVFGDIKKDVLNFLCMDIPIVAHQLRFDATMLIKELGPAWPEGIPTLCTLDYSKYRNPVTKTQHRHRLIDVAQFFGVEIDPDSFHGALYDSVVLAKVVPGLMAGTTVGETFTKMSEEWITNHSGGTCRV